MLSCIRLPRLPSLFFFNDTATTEIYTLSLHDALPISEFVRLFREQFVANAAELDALFEHCQAAFEQMDGHLSEIGRPFARSEEHTSELQSRLHLVCRLLLEKKKRKSHHES